MRLLKRPRYQWRSWQNNLTRYWSWGYVRRLGQLKTGFLNSSTHFDEMWLHVVFDIFPYHFITLSYPLSLYVSRANSLSYLSKARSTSICMLVCMHIYYRLSFDRRRRLWPPPSMQRRRWDRAQMHICSCRSWSRATLYRHVYATVSYIRLSYVLNIGVFGTSAHSLTCVTLAIVDRSLMSLIAHVQESVSSPPVERESLSGKAKTVRLLLLLALLPISP